MHFILEAFITSHAQNESLENLVNFKALNQQEISVQKKQARIVSDVVMI